MRSTSGSQDGFGPSKATPLRVSVCSSQTLPHHGSLQSPGSAVSWVGWGKPELTARDGGKSVM